MIPIVLGAIDLDLEFGLKFDSKQSTRNLQVLGPRLAMEGVDWQYEIFAGPAGQAIFC